MHVQLVDARAKCLCRSACGKRACSRLREQDLIKPGHAPPCHLDPDLRLIRVRSTTGRETPQWWGNAAPGRINGLPPGMWAETEDAEFTSGRIFYSTTAKAGTFRDSAV